MYKKFGYKKSMTRKKYIIGNMGREKDAITLIRLPADIQSFFPV
jgi:hypothetical protein